MIIIKVIRDEEEELQLHVDEHVSVDAWINTFKTILTWLTFQDETIKQLFDGTFTEEEGE